MVDSISVNDNAARFSEGFPLPSVIVAETANGKASATPQPIRKSAIPADIAPGAVTRSVMPTATETADARTRMMGPRLSLSISPESRVKPMPIVKAA